MLDKLDNVPASHDAPEGWQTPPVLATRALRPRRPQGRPANRRSSRRTRRAGPGAREGPGAGDHRQPRQPDLFIADDGDEAIPVRLKRIRLERGRTFGDVWLGSMLWPALRLPGAGA